MKIRVAACDDAAEIVAIYAPLVTGTTISFEVDPPTVAQMRERIAATLERFPWLVAEDDAGRVGGYVYASRHRERAAYRWSVDVTAYVREDLRRRGVGRRLYPALFEQLTVLGYFQAFAGITLPNDASVALHEAVGFEPVGIYRNVGFKGGAWRDVGWWQRALQPPSVPHEPLSFGSAAGS